MSGIDLLTQASKVSPQLRFLGQVLSCLAISLHVFTLVNKSFRKLSVLVSLTKIVRILTQFQAQDNWLLFYGAERGRPGMHRDRTLSPICAFTETERLPFLVDMGIFSFHNGACGTGAGPSKIMEVSMKIKAVWLIIILILAIGRGSAEIGSLSQIFLLGKGLKDLDGDHNADKIGFYVIIPDHPSAAEIAVAADIAARANLESLSQDLALVKKELEIKRHGNEESLILVGSNLKLIQDLTKKAGLAFPELGPRQGAVYLLGPESQTDVAVVAGSDEALLKTGRAFFLRWPYFWEVWGRENGVTYFTLEKDLSRLLEAEGIPSFKIIIRAAFYEFPLLTSAHDAIKRLKYDAGEIKDLWVEVYFSDRNNKDKIRASLESLILEHRQGLRPDVLSYPGCAQITFILKEGSQEARLTLPRLGYPKRMLTPGYKDAAKRSVPEKDFDLLSLFSAKGFYSDSDKDGILDSLDSVAVFPKNLTLEALAPLASRLVLASAGASFPILQMEDEVEDIKALTSPLLIGDNSFSRELIKTGKLKLPTLESGGAAAQVVPKGFNKSNALAFNAADGQGLEKILTYFSETFPYFAEYKEGSPQLADVSSDLEKFLLGEKGSAEAYIRRNIHKIAEEIKEKELASFEAEVYLPQENPKFVESLEGELKKSLQTAKLEIKNHALKQNKVIFEKEKEFPWEADEALALLQEKTKALGAFAEPLKISLGLSESPPVRQKIKAQIEEWLRQNNIPKFEVEVLCSYKQGFFWLTEKVLSVLQGKSVSGLTIRFAEEKDDFSLPKRFYREPLRWLEELYPADEILASGLSLPLDKIHFEMKTEKQPVYEVIALDSANNALLRESFSPRTREIPYIRILPEWGHVTVATDWLHIEKGDELVFDTPLQSDLEKFWDYYQEEILSPLYSYIMKKTGNEPSTTKQPYFKRLFLEVRFSEPDYKLGLDEEIVSSLEAMHDEIYFDTLDFLRGITKVEVEDQDLPEDTSRLSAPGNILPYVHPSSEGERGKVKVVFEDSQAPSPQAVLKWKEKGREEEYTKTVIFPPLKAKTTNFPAFIYNGKLERMENLTADLEFEKEADYLALLDIIQSYGELQKDGLLGPSFSYPRLHSLTLKIKHKDLEKEEVIPISYGGKEEKQALLSETDGSPVKTDEIISPEMCLDVVRRLSRYPVVKTYTGGISYENREVPVIELFTPQGKYVSLPRLVTFKPTLFISGRQHANEVSSTNYILKFAELLATDASYRDYVKKMNIILEPMENPDGAALAFDLQKLTPFHSLHAGRYSSLGLDIGYQVGSSKPLLPEAAVRKNLNDRWHPDIYLNLHGYPSHEWVQAFSNYSPYLFREYWIPKGWFAYYEALRLPVYEKWKEAGEELEKVIVEEMQRDPKIRESNEKLSNRFWRWAGRWQPHLDYLELHDGLNLYAARRGSQESKLTPRRQMTFVEETPELMDETARGDWLEFLSQEGLTYLKAQAKYLSQVLSEISRIEEEIQDRVRIQFSRSRPGKLKSVESAAR